MVNIFADQTDASIRESCRNRLIHISEIAGDLQEIMSKTSSFSCIKMSSVGPLIDMNAIHVMQKATTINGMETAEIVSKAVIST